MATGWESSELRMTSHVFGVYQTSVWDLVLPPPWGDIGQVPNLSEPRLSHQFSGDKDSTHLSW